MDEALAYFLDLRVRVRGRPEAVAVVDRCIALIVQAATADAATLARLEAEVEELRAALEARFARKPPLAFN